MIKTTVGNMLATLISHKLLTRTQALDIACKAESGSNYAVKVTEAQKLGISFIFENIYGTLHKEDLVWMQGQTVTKSTKLNSYDSIW